MLAREDRDGVREQGAESRERKVGKGMYRGQEVKGCRGA
jgi:hypothetical protein